MLAQAAQVADTRPFQTAHSAPRDVDLAALQSELAQAQRPLLVVGGSGWTPEACAEVTAFAEAGGLPVVASFRRQDLFDNAHDNYAGHLGLGINPRLAEKVRSADLLVVIGSRLSEVTSGGYTLIASPCPEQRLVHVHPDPEELGRVYQATLFINSGTSAFASALKSLAPVKNPAWRPWLTELRRDLEAFGRPPDPDAAHRGVHLATVVSQLTESLPRDAIICNGAGNYTLWVHRFHKYRRFRSELAPVGGAMGYGLPAAIAAKLRHPDRTVVCFAGDGCFLMYPQELGHCGPVRRGGHRAGREQRHVRHDPHAPGAPLPGTRLEHRSRESRFRGAGAFLRRVCRAGIDDGRFHRRVWPSAERRGTGAARAVRRSGSNHTDGPSGRGRIGLAGC